MSPQATVVRSREMTAGEGPHSILLGRKGPREAGSWVLAMDKLHNYDERSRNRRPDTVCTVQWLSILSLIVGKETFSEDKHSDSYIPAPPSVVHVTDLQLVLSA